MKMHPKASEKRRPPAIDEFRKWYGSLSCPELVTLMSHEISY